MEIEQLTIELEELGVQWRSAWLVFRVMLER